MDDRWQKNQLELAWREEDRGEAPKINPAGTESSAAKRPFDLVGDSMPLSWRHQFDGGRESYIALGHKKEDYANQVLYGHILGGILWVMGQK